MMIPGTSTLPSKPYFTLLPQSNHCTVSVRAAMAEVAQPVVDRRSLYEVLRLKQNASPGEIKTAYRTLAKLYHPDATSGFLDSSVAPSSDGRDFIEIRNAYATLSDPNARAAYDMKLNDDSKRRWNISVGADGIRGPGRGGSCPTRKWETDQCW